MNPQVCILMGSDSDLPTMESTISILREFNITFEIHIASAHRTPQQTQDIIRASEQNGCQVFIAAAGLAAHLAGTVAAHTTKPVIGVPLDGGGLQGFDSLLSTVQMPGGVPVATVAIGKAGAKNAAFLAAQILALQNPEVDKQLHAMRESQRAVIAEKNSKLHHEIGN